jgi:starch phosphorylase
MLRLFAILSLKGFYQNMATNMSPEEMKNQLTEKLSGALGVPPEEATNVQFYKALSMICMEMMSKQAYNFTNAAKDVQGTKKVCYLCMEFLMGRSLKNNLYNLGLTQSAKEALEGFGINLTALYEQEPDAGLGNGGLGRLAACYMDALASGHYPAVGYSILYEYGIFKQKLIDGWQTELPDFWLPGGEAWLSPQKSESLIVEFGGELDSKWDGNYFTSKLKNTIPVVAIPYDMYVPGKGGEAVNVLRLWKSDAPGMDMSLFNQGDYIRAIEQDAMAQVISKVLYPSDNHPEGKSLRLRQQYFLVSASVQDIIRKHLRMYKTLDNFTDKVAIHINDTHPTLAIPEMMRLLLDDCGYSWDDAWSIVTKVFAYTNHTVMKEALECWQEDLVRQLIPRIYQIIKEIDNRYRSKIWDLYHNADKVENMAVISNGIVRMANLDVAVCHSVNGVSALHSDILKETIFKDYYELTPDKFTNVTNGIAHRRWLAQSNPGLTSLINDLIGDGFIMDAIQLSRLKNYADDIAVNKRIGEIKHENKIAFAEHLKTKTGIIIDPDSVFDVQVKRLHEYKRQHLNAFEILLQYLQLKDDPDMDFTPHTYIFGGKAAPGYFMAKKIISFILALADMIDNDPAVKDKIKIVYLEDYNVSTAEALMPASEISEQISLAGTEASGTSNMKLMMNGALTLGTLDGANVEMKENVGDDNIFIFGMTAQEVSRLSCGYQPSAYYNNTSEIRRIIDFCNGGIGGKMFPEISGTIVHNDPYMVLADFMSYHEVRNNMIAAYKDTSAWNRMSLMNIAGSGVFSADEAIRHYANEIWNTKPLDI